MPGRSLETPMQEQTRNANIADTIFAELRRKILSGELKAGERLSGERELAIKYGTNRNTLREAVRKLEQARLVTVRHGQGVTVADFRRTPTRARLRTFSKTYSNLASSCSSMRRGSPCGAPTRTTSSG